MMEIDMESTNKTIRDAIHDLNDFKNRESDYGRINRLLAIINTFVQLDRATVLMAEKIAEQDTRTAAEVLAEFYEEVGIK